MNELSVKLTAHTNREADETWKRVYNQWALQALELEIENERLAKCHKLAVDELATLGLKLDSYEAAVAEIQTVLGLDPDIHDLDTIALILNKLPK